jgi:glycosyltransferase involved in cell wall biosynthesis
LHNIDSIRTERVLEHTPFGFTKLYQYLNQRRFKRWEMESLARYDTVMTMSEIDKRSVLAELPELRVSVVPNGVDCRGIAFAPVSYPPKSLLLVSSFGSDANRDAAMVLLDTIFPLVVRRHPDATVTIVGRDPRPELLARHDDRRVFVTGTVPDVMPYYRTAAVAVVPLRAGGGTRLKILEAMAAGVPVVSTSIGAEGLDVVPGEHLLIADDPEAFAAAIDRLLTAASVRVAITASARKLVERLYDWASIAEQHDDVYRLSVTASWKS